MSIKEKVHYSRFEDYIYGLDNCTSATVDENPKMATKMLCFVVHGLSTKYTMPAGYFFHVLLPTDTLNYKTITLNVLKLLTECVCIVLRLVTDNISSNVALFRMLSNGQSKNYISHPFLEYIPLNARNLFLDLDMCSSEGTISSTYLKNLYTMKLGLPINTVRYLTKKYLYPTNLEKMNVLRAVEVFFPSVTSSLRFLEDAEDSKFTNVDATTDLKKKKPLQYKPTSRKVLKL